MLASRLWTTKVTLGGVTRPNPAAALFRKGTRATTKSMKLSPSRGVAPPPIPDAYILDGQESFDDHTALGCIVA